MIEIKMIEREKLKDYINIIKILPIPSERKLESVNNVENLIIIFKKLNDYLLEQIDNQEMIDKVISGLFNKSFQDKIMSSTEDVEDENVLFEVLTECFSDIFKKYEMIEESENIKECLLPIMKLHYEFSEIFETEK
jgi:hypothetical protein